MVAGVSALCWVAVCDCGARTPLGGIANDSEIPGDASAETAPPSEAGPDAPSLIDATSDADAPVAPDADAAPPCNHWSVWSKPPVALTSPEGDSQLTGMAVEGDGVFVGTMNNNDPSPDPTWRVRWVSGDVENLGPSQVAFKHPQGVSLSGISLSSRLGHRGAIVWDESGGCRFAALSGDGSPSSPVSITDAWCAWLRATPAGFTAFAAQPFSLDSASFVSLDPSGALLSSKQDVIPGTTSADHGLTRANFEDGSMLIVWRHGDASALAMRLSEAGEALNAPKELSGLSGNARVSIAATGSGALLAYSQAASDYAVRLIPMDKDGNPTGAETTVAEGDGIDVGFVDVASTSSGAMVAWSKGATGSYHTLRARPVTTSGTIDGDALLVPSAQFLGTVKLANTESGLVLLFSGEKAGTLTQVFATRLICSQ